MLKQSVILFASAYGGIRCGKREVGAGVGPEDSSKIDLLFGKVALNRRFISKDLLNRALHYQKTQEPWKRLGEILVEKGQHLHIAWHAGP